MLNQFFLFLNLIMYYVLIFLMVKIFNLKTFKYIMYSYYKCFMNCLSKNLVNIINYNVMMYIICDFINRLNKINDW